MIIFNLNGQQWVDDSCNKKASEIVNEAVEHLANLEQLMAVGMAKAALMLDDDCGCANLVMAAAAARIEDTDFAKETANLTKNSVLNQSAMAMVAQANQAQSAILAVLQ